MTGRQGLLYVLTYAARYPDEVAGMVLVDSTAPASQPGALPPSQEPTPVSDRISALVSASARTGLGRVLGWLAAGLPPQYEDQVRTRSASANSIRSTIDEYREGSTSTKQAAALTNFADKPLIVLTAGSGHDATWLAAQERLATLSTNSAHRVIAEATHAALVAEEKPAAATSQAILEVVSAVRHPALLRK